MLGAGVGVLGAGAGAGAGAGSGAGALGDLRRRKKIVKRANAEKGYYAKLLATHLPLWHVL